MDVHSLDQQKSKMCENKHCIYIHAQITRAHTHTHSRVYTGVGTKSDTLLSSPWLRKSLWRRRTGGLGLDAGPCRLRPMAGGLLLATHGDWGSSTSVPRISGARCVSPLRYSLDKAMDAFAADEVDASTGVYVRAALGGMGGIHHTASSSSTVGRCTFRKQYPVRASGFSNRTGVGRSHVKWNLGGPPNTSLQNSQQSSDHGDKAGKQAVVRGAYHMSYVICHAHAQQQRYTTMLVHGLKTESRPLYSHPPRLCLFPPPHERRIHRRYAE